MKTSNMSKSAQAQYNELMCSLEKTYGREQISQLCEYAKYGDTKEESVNEIVYSNNSSYGD